MEKKSVNITIVDIMNAMLVNRVCSEKDLKFLAKIQSRLVIMNQGVERIKARAERMSDKYYEVSRIHYDDVPKKLKVKKQRKAKYERNWKNVYTNRFKWRGKIKKIRSF